MPKKKSDAEHPISNSRLKQHIKECHRFLITENKTLSSLVLDIKLHTQNKYRGDKDKVKCPDCGLFFKKGQWLYSHRKHMHNYHAGDDEQMKLNNAIQKINQEHSLSLLDCLLNEYCEYLEAWDGRGLKKTTAKKYKSALRAIAEHLKISSLFDILNDSVCDQLSAFIQAESSRISCGVSHHLTALKHFGSFLTCRKRIDVSERKLDHHLQSFKVCNQINFIRHDLALL